jgi:hypothetical protein
MIDLPFYWTFVVIAAVVDVVGLFFLWRRRSSPVGASYIPARGVSGRMRIVPIERRRGDRRDPGRAASA